MRRTFRVGFPALELLFEVSDGGAKLLAVRVEEEAAPPEVGLPWTSHAQWAFVLEALGRCDFVSSKWIAETLGFEGPNGLGPARAEFDAALAGLGFRPEQVYQRSIKGKNRGWKPGPAAGAALAAWRKA
jgi:hypothetical protein